MLISNTNFFQNNTKPKDQAYLTKSTAKTTQRCK